MCGITGWFYTPGREPAPESLKKMAQAIRHRGPDDEGFFRDPAAGLALAHRRLSIFDWARSGANINLLILASAASVA